MAARRLLNTLTSGRSALSALALLLGLGVSAYCTAVAIGSDYWWLGWVTLLPLFQAIRILPPGSAFCAGAFWGCSLFAVSLFSGRGLIDADAQSFLLVNLIPGAYAFFGARLTRSVGFSPYLLALGWIGVELALRPLGLRYGLLAGTQADGVVLGYIGSFAGYVLVAFLVAYVNASLVNVLSEVRVSIVQPRLVAGGCGAQQRVFPLEVPGFLSRFFLPAQPRGPPLS